MKGLKYIQEKFKEFKPTSWAIDNKTVTYVAVVFISLYGLFKFLTLPREQFPDITVPTISIATVYVGNGPKEIENLVTRPLEKQIKGITGAKVTKVQSTSQQDFSLIVVEFDTDVKTEFAKQKVKDAVDKAKTDLPNNLTIQPDVLEFSFSEFPIMYATVSGDYDPVRLKQYAEKLKDRIETISEINKATIVGAPEREIQINVDPIKMQAAKLSFRDIENAVAYENNDISGGQVSVGDMQRSIRVKGQFKSVMDLQNIIVKNVDGAPYYLRDIAELKDGLKETDNFARLNGNNGITLNLVKRSGENLINAADKVKAAVAEMKKNEELPPNLNVTFSGDLSKATATSFNELVNTIIIGFILVLIVLMFFMGVSNAFFVALSVPLSVFVAFMFLFVAKAMIGTEITLNFIVLFALLFGLGIIVDDAIVVIENTHRIYENGKVNIVKAAKMAAGEVFIPVLAGTATTLAPFFPLLFWKGLIGRFMVYFPVMLILTLSASLIVAFLINPVFAVSFMKPEGKENEKKPSHIWKSKYFWVLIIGGVLFNIIGLISGTKAWNGLGNFSFILAVLMVLNVYFLQKIIHYFQKTLLPNLMNKYETLLRWALNGWRPVWLLISLFVLFGLSIFFMMLRSNPVVFFPSGDPNNIFVYLKMPVGTKVEKTNEVLLNMEKTVNNVLGKNKPGGLHSITESVISNVAVGANDPQDQNRSTQSNLGRIQIAFVEFEKRDGEGTLYLVDSLKAALQAPPGSLITVEPEKGGPPTDAPVNIEITGDNFDEIAKVATELKNYLDTNNVKGLAPMKLDVDLLNPEITITVDRERALLEGVSTGQVGMEVRTAIFGKEISKLKDGEDDYKIQLRYSDLQRNNITDLMNMRITFKDFATFSTKQVPLSAIANFDITNTSGGIKRKNYKRTIQLGSNIDPAKANEVNLAIAPYIEKFKRNNNLPNGVSLSQTGEGEQQKETGIFLAGALLTALIIIYFILVLQFNSLAKPMIVLSEIFFSIIGVILGFAITGKTISILMVGVGVVGLAGIVIKNGILLIEFTEELRERGMKTKEAAILAGRTRIIPVLLTAVATILGLLPLAIGFNIDFGGLLTSFKPNIFLGGESVVFWGPLSWTIIYGLIFSFFLTLLMVPAMYIISERLRRPMTKFYGSKWIALLSLVIGPLFFIFAAIMYTVNIIRGKKIWNGTLKNVKKLSK